MVVVESYIVFILLNTRSTELVKTAKDETYIIRGNVIGDRRENAQ